MKAYFDTSVVVSLFQSEPHSAALGEWVLHTGPVIHFSDFGALEFAAAVSLIVRSGRQTDLWALKTVSSFDAWRRDIVELTMSSIQVGRAERLVRDFRTKLAAPDALHIAMAAHMDLALVTFDQRMANAARIHDISVIMPGS